jgi:hypothetical protein
MPSRYHVQLIATLGRYMSGVNAHGVVGRALRSASLDADLLSVNDFPALAPALDRGIRLFVEPDRRAMLWQELDALTKGDASAVSIAVQREQIPNLDEVLSGKYRSKP